MPLPLSKQELNEQYEYDVTLEALERENERVSRAYAEVLESIKALPIATSKEQKAYAKELNKKRVGLEILLLLVMNAELRFRKTDPRKQKEKEKEKEDRSFNNLQNRIVHPMQYLFFIYSLWDSLCGEGNIGVFLMSLYMEKFTQAALNVLYTDERIQDRINHVMPKNYSFLTNIGSALSNGVISAIQATSSAVTSGLGEVGRQLNHFMS